MLNVIANVSNENICIGIVYTEDEPVVENDICLGISEEVENPISYIGKQYHKETGKWTIPIYNYYAQIENDIVVHIVECLKNNKQLYQEDMILCTIDSCLCFFIKYPLFINFIFRDV